MKDYMLRYSQFFKHIQKLGIANTPTHPLHKIFHLHRFNLDYGMTYLHTKAFVPAIELLGSDE